MTIGFRTFRDSDDNYWLFRFPQAERDFVYLWGPVHRAGFERRVRAQFPDHCETIVDAMRTVTIYNFWLPSTLPPIRNDALYRWKKTTLTISRAPVAITGSKMERGIRHAGTT